MKGVQCYELFGGIAPKIHTFSFFFHLQLKVNVKLRKMSISDTFLPLIKVLRPQKLLIYSLAISTKEALKIL